MTETENIITRAKALFAVADIPPATLRGGNALDNYDEPPPFDAAIDEPTDDYLLKYHWGLPFLDPQSWQYYFPFFIDYSFRHLGEEGNMVVDSFLSSLRPPDRDPPRFAPLTKDQRQVIIAFLDILAFDESSGFKEAAMQVLEEYWIPGALYKE